MNNEEKIKQAYSIYEERSKELVELDIKLKEKREQHTKAKFELARQIYNNCEGHTLFISGKIITTEKVEDTIAIKIEQFTGTVI